MSSSDETQVPSADPGLPQIEMSNEQIVIQFACGPLLADYLQRNAAWHNVTQHYDEYFDGPNSPLHRQGWWLRRRDHKQLSMKVTTAQSSTSVVQAQACFEEVTDETKILALIRAHLPKPARRKRGGKSQPLSPLDLATPVPCAHYPFIRHTFGTNFGTIYVDEMSLSPKCDDFYIVGATTVQHSSEIAPTLSFLRAMGLHSGPVRSKVIEWLHVRDKELHGRLMQAGVVPDVPYTDVPHFPTTLISKSLDWFRNCLQILTADDTTEQ